LRGRPVRYRRLRRLVPDADLIRRRAAGETFRALAPDYGVSPTTLSRYFARPGVAKQVKQAEQLLRAEQRAAEARWRAEQKAEREARPLANRQTLAEGQTAAGRARPKEASGVESASAEPSASVRQPAGRILRRRPEAEEAWLQRQKISREGPAFGLVRLVRLDGTGHRHVEPAEVAQLIETGECRRA
jgi:hypothetical protein